jgi:hypothetical protein
MYKDTHLAFLSVLYNCFCIGILCVPDLENSIVIQSYV